jgi:hypothetical protein
MSAQESTKAFGQIGAHVERHLVVQWWNEGRGAELRERSEDPIETLVGASSNCGPLMNDIDEPASDASGQDRLNNLNRRSKRWSSEHCLQVLPGCFVAVRGAVLDLCQKREKRVSVSNDLLALRRRMRQTDSFLAKVGMDAVEVVRVEDGKHVLGGDVGRELIDTLINLVDMLADNLLCPSSHRARWGVFDDATEDDLAGGEVARQAIGNESFPSSLAESLLAE